jgi:hypothetical protein
MDMARHAAGGVPVANAICQNDARDVVAAGKYGVEIAALLAPGGNGNHVAFQTSQLQGAMRTLVPSPKLHAAEGPCRGSGAIHLPGFDFLEFHR